MVTKLSMLLLKPFDDTAVFEIISQSDRGKCLVIKSDLTFGTLTLVQQKCVDIIPDHEPEFDSDADVVPLDDGGGY